MTKARITHPLARSGMHNGPSLPLHRGTAERAASLWIALALAIPAQRNADAEEPPVERSAWQYTERGDTITIVNVQDQEWTALRPDGRKPVYDELDVTDEFVELRNRTTRLHIRLHADRAFWRRERDTDWTRWVNGRWIADFILPEAARPAAVPDSSPPRGPDGYVVRLAYFVPQDRQPLPDYERKIRLVMSVVSELYRTALRSQDYPTDGFKLETRNGEPVIHLLRGERNASHYNDAPAYNANEQWRRLVPEIRSGLGDTRRQVLVVFAETYDDGPADVLWPGVIARGAYYSAEGGLAIYTSHILRDEFCALTLDDQRRIFFDQTPVPGRKAWGHRLNSPRCEFAEDGFGAVAHELGHAFGLPHDLRDDRRYIMGNGFRNLRWNFAVPSPPDRRIGFSGENALLLMSSRYIAPDLNTADNQPPAVNLTLIAARRAVTATVNVHDDTGLRALVLFDENAGSVIGGRKLTGRSQQFRERLPESVLKTGEIRLRAIVTDDGGNQTRTSQTLQSR